MHERALRSLGVLVVAVAFLAPALALAQDFSGQSAFSLTISPQYPAPNSSVVVTPFSSSIDLANATYVLTVNGKEVYRGNAKPVSVTVGAAGTLTTIKGTATAVGGTQSQTITLRPQDVALVVEPIASAPPLYPGKPLIPLEGSVRIVAVANLRTAGGAQIDPGNLSYTWTVNGAQVARASGIGKAAVLVQSPLQYRQGDVSVLVQSQDSALVGSADLTITPQEPTVRIYENDPLLGIRYEHALTGSYTIPGSEITLYGATYSFPTASAPPALEWFLSGASAQTGHSITLRPTGAGQGTANLSLTASAGSFTSASAALSLTFGSSGSNFFGL